MEQLLAHVVHAVGALWASTLSRPVPDVWWTRGEVARTYALLRMMDGSAAPRLAWYAAIDPQLRRSEAAIRDAVERALALVATDGVEVLERILVMVPERGPRQQAEVLRALRGSSRQAVWGHVLRSDPASLTLPSLEAFCEKNWLSLSPWWLAAAARRSASDAPALLAKAWSFLPSLEDEEALALASQERGQLGADGLVTGRQVSLAQRLSASGDVHPLLARALVDPGKSILASAVLAGAVPSEAQACFLTGALESSAEQFEEGLITRNDLEEIRYASALCEGAASVDALLAQDKAVALREARAWVDSLGLAPPVVTGPSVRKGLDRQLAALERARTTSDWSARAELERTLARLLQIGAWGDTALVGATVRQLEADFGSLSEQVASGELSPLAIEVLTFCSGRSRKLAEARGDLGGEHSRRRQVRLLAGLWRDGEGELAREVMVSLRDAPAGSLPWWLVDELVRVMGAPQQELLGQVQRAAREAVAQLSGPEPIEAWSPAAARASA